MTELLYITQPASKQAEAKVTHTFINKSGMFCIILDKTTLYPKGGGQPSDIGIITLKNGTHIQITSCYIDHEAGTIIHELSGSSHDIEEGTRVTISFDTGIRLLHSKFHTAGHVLDKALNDLGIAHESIKGFHYPQGAYVLYKEFAIPPKEEIDTAIQHIINQNHPITITVDETQQKQGKALRFMQIGAYEKDMCGGTHVSNTSELAGLRVRKIKNSKEGVRVSYEFKNQ